MPKIIGVPISLGGSKHHLGQRQVPYSVCFLENWLKPNGVCYLVGGIYHDWCVHFMSGIHRFVKYCIAFFPSIVVLLKRLNSIKMWCKTQVLPL